MTRESHVNDRKSILIVDGSESLREDLELIFGKEGYEAEAVGTGQEALNRTQSRSFDLAILNVRLPDMSGIDLLMALKETQPDIAVVMTNGDTSQETAANALSRGASAYTCAPLSANEALITARQALERQQLAAENKQLRQEIQQELTQRRQAEEKLRQRTVQLETLRQVVLETTAQLDLDELLHSIVSRAIDLTGGDAGGIYLYRSDREVLEWAVSIGSGLPPTGTLLHRGEGLSGKVWETGEPLVIDDYQYYEEQATQDQHPTAAVVSVPVRWGKEFLGILNVHSQTVADIEHASVRASKAFSLADAELLSLLASSAAIAIRNARLYKETKQRLTESKLVQEVMLGTTSTLDFDLALERTVKALHRTLGIDHLSFLLPNDQETHLVSHPSLANVAEHTLEIPLEGSRVGRVYLTGQPVLVRDATQVPARPDYAEVDSAIQSSLAVPVRIGDHVVAVLCAGSHQAGDFGGEELRLFTTIAGQLGVALQNARLFASLAQEKERLDLLFRLSHRLAKSLDIRDVAQRALEDICTVVGAKQGVALVREPRGDRLRLVAIYGQDTDSAEALDQRIRLRMGEGLTGWVAAQRTSALLRDVTQDERWKTVPGLDEWARSAVSVPLVSGDDLIGTLGVYSDQVGFFDEEHRLLIESAAATVAAAVANARLYEGERDRRQEAETLREAALALTTALDRDEVVERILAQLQEVVPYDTASVQLFREDRMELVGGRGFPNLPDLLDLSFPTDGDNPNSEVVRTRAPFIAKDVPAAYEDFQKEPHVQTCIRSWLGVPMLTGERLVGMIALDKHEPGFYTQEHARLAEAFAAQAAIAIDNSRLFQAEREQRDLAKALEKAAAVVSSTLHPDQVLDRILEQVERIVAGDAFNIMLIADDTARVVRWRGYEHVNPDQISAVAISIDQYPSLAKMMQTGEPVVIPDTAAASDWTPLEDQEWRLSYVAAPIRVKEKTVGFLNVNGTRSGQFTPADARRLEAFAAHAAIAIENAQLYRELRAHAEQLERRVQERTAQLQAQYARLEAILDSATDGIVVADAAGEILQTNPVAQTWLNQTLSPKEATQLREAVQDLAQRAEERPERVLELTGLDLELKAAPISQPGMDEVSAVVAVHDVSHLKALDRVKSKFVSSVSHELRTPITTIKLYGSLLQHTSPDEAKWGKYVDVLVQEADWMAQLVDNILQISRIDTGRLEMKPHPTLLNELTEETVLNHQRSAQEQGLHMEHRPAVPGPATLVDSVRMMQVLNILVDNAIRYTPEGGDVVISTAREEAEGRLWATVTVADTGMGIPEEELSHIFERFFRGKKPRLMQMPGTGLGLAIARQIVELHGGRMTVESQVDVGSTFTIWLPLAEQTMKANAVTE